MGSGIAFSKSTVETTREGIHTMAEQAWKRFLKTGSHDDAEKGNKLRNLRDLFDELMKEEEICR